MSNGSEVGAVIGAAIGFAVAGPSGAKAGFAIGSPLFGRSEMPREQSAPHKPSAHTAAETRAADCDTSKGIHT